MKSAVILITMFFSFASMAHLEHRAGQETVPSSERLSKARGCFREIAEHGCGHPRDGQEEFNTCLEIKKEMLTETCQTFFKKLYGKREVLRKPDSDTAL